MDLPKIHSRSSECYRLRVSTLVEEGRALQILVVGVAGVVNDMVTNRSNEHYFPLSWCP
jgi:hypothetical protein